MNRRNISICFPGQGFQKLGMLSQWVKRYPKIIYPILEEMDEALKLNMSGSLVSESEGLLDQNSVNLTSNAQPLLLTAGYAIFSVLDHHINKDITKYCHFLGHSLGEYTAWTAANILPYSDAVKTVRKRGLAMERATQMHMSRYGHSLGMSVVLLPATASNASIRDKLFENIKAHPEKVVDVGNINSNTQIVLSGIVGDIAEIVAQTSADTNTRLRTRALPVSGPFHSRIMQPGQESMKAILQGSEIRWKWPPSTPVISNITARPFQSLEEVHRSVVDTLVEPVRWSESVSYASQDGECTIVSLGPGNIGKQTANEIVSDTLYVQEPDDIKSFI